MAIAKQLVTGVEQLDLDLTSAQLQQLTDYLSLLAKWNRVYNLSAVRDPREMVVTHLLDSLALVPHLPSGHDRILDVGSGAGLPGIPLAVACPEKQFVLLDSNGKKTRFLQQVKIDLGLSNLSVVQQRFEDYRPEKNFAIVVSRAFTSLQAFFHTGRQLLSDNGQLFAMKGKRPVDEIAALPDQNVVAQVVPLMVPFLDAERHLIVAH